MQNILKIILPILLAVGCFSCDTLENTHYPINPMNAKQKKRMDVLLDRTSGEGKGIYKSRIDTTPDHTVLHLTYSDKQTDLSDLESFLIGEDLINKNYIPQVTLDSMVRAKVLHDSLKLVESLEDEEELPAVVKQMEPVKPVKVKDLIPTNDSIKSSVENVSSEESNSPSVVTPDVSNSNLIENTDSI